MVTPVRMQDTGELHRQMKMENTASKEDPGILDKLIESSNTNIAEKDKKDEFVSRKISGLEGELPLEETIWLPQLQYRTIQDMIEIN